MKLDMDAPWLIKAMPAVDAWQNNPRVQLALSNFGGQYKKDTKNTDGRGQLPMFKADAKGETDAMFDVIEGFGRADIAGPSKNTLVRIIGKNTWLYGNDPKMHFCSTSPFSVAMVKAQAAGNTRFVLIDFVTFCEARKKEGLSDIMPQQQMTTLLQEMTVDNAKALCKQGLKMEHVTQQPWEALYIPAGWVAMEKTARGSLAYGSRRSLVVTTDQTIVNYNAMIAMASEGKKSIVNMKGVKKAMLAHLGQCEDTE